MTPAAPLTAAVQERLARSTRREGLCIVWTGATIDGYGSLWWRGGTTLAHRLAYQTFVGPIPDGLVIDHLCRRRACVNTAHMEVVTNEENIRRGVGGINNRSKTHCNRGHEYTPENIRSSNGRRYCRACDKARWAA